MEKDNKNLIPNNIIDIFLTKNKIYPSIIKTKNIVKDGFNLLKEKNESIWLYSDYDGVNIILKEGLLKYGKTDVYVYFKRVEHENVYNINVLYLLKDTENLNFLLKGLNKYFTID
jgi:hypothetical protein